MRFHLLALPSSQTTRDYFLCGFCQLTIRFARLLKDLGHTVFLYASEENEAPCDELICCITKEEQAGVLGGLPYQWANSSNGCWPLWEKSNARMIAAIRSLNSSAVSNRSRFMCASYLRGRRMSFTPSSGRTFPIASGAAEFCRA